jgi:uncharacterized ParB-like nuclease family protein
MAKIQKVNVSLDQIVVNMDILQREKISDSIIEDYAEDLHAGVIFPPVDVFFDGKSFILSDGFHRYHAFRKAGKTEIDCKVIKGTFRDALLHSLKSNKKHGLRRTREDKWICATTILKDEEWCKWSNNAIAKTIGVSHTFIGSVKKELATLQVGNSPSPDNRVVKTSNGKSMRTGKIGKSSSTTKGKKSNTVEPIHAVSANESVNEISGDDVMGVSESSVELSQMNGKEDEEVNVQLESDDSSRSNESLDSADESTQINNHEEEETAQIESDDSEMFKPESAEELSESVTDEDSQDVGDSSDPSENTVDTEMVEHRTTVEPQDVQITVNPSNNLTRAEILALVDDMQNSFLEFIDKATAEDVDYQSFLAAFNSHVNFCSSIANRSV